MQTEIYMLADASKLLQRAPLANNMDATRSAQLSSQRAQLLAPRSMLLKLYLAKRRNYKQS